MTLSDDLRNLAIEAAQADLDYEVATRDTRASNYEQERRVAYKRYIEARDQLAEAIQREARQTNE